MQNSETNQVYLIRSVDRTATSASSSNFRLKPDTSLLGQYEVLYAMLYNTVYSVNTGINDTIYFTENSTTKTAAIPAGQYTTTGAASIATAVASTLTTASGGYATYTVAISSTTQCMTITSTQNFSLTFGTNTNKSACKVLGYASVDTSSATSQVAPNLPNLACVSSLCINIPQSSISSWYSGSGYYGSILIPLDVSFGALKYYKKDDFCQYVRFDQPISAFDVLVRDTSNNAVNLNGSEFEIAIRKI